MTDCTADGCTCAGLYYSGTADYLCYYHYKVKQEPSWLRNWSLRPIENQVPDNGHGCTWHKEQ